MNIDSRISLVNAKLKTAKVGVSIETRGDHLWLRATLPPKPHINKPSPYQQRVSLGVRATVAGLQHAEQKARLMGAQLDLGKFNWEEWLETPTDSDSVKSWVERFEQDYWSRVKRTQASQTTWKTEYAQVFRKLPASEILNLELLLNVIQRTQPDSRNRKRHCINLYKLAEFAGLENREKIKELTGNYSATAVNPRTLPTDVAIAQFRDSISSPAWQWLVGMLATYGLRGHEVFRLELSDFPVVRVLDGKTGARFVYNTGMLTFNYRYRLYPDVTQEQRLIEWLELCRGAYNYALRELKDWCDSRKCLIDRCSTEKEYILPADLKFPSEVQQLNNLPKAKKEFPRLSEVPSQVLQQAVKQLHRGWEYFQERGFGFPRFKKYGQFKSLLFPQFKENPVTSKHVKLPKIGAIPINLHRPIPTGFVVKQVRIMRKANKWYASVNIQCDVSVQHPVPHGHAIGVDVGLEKFLATSDGTLVKPPKFFKKLLRQLKLLQRRLSRKLMRSKNYEKQRIKVAGLHHTIDNTRKDFHFKQAHALCDDGDMVFMEDLDYARLAKGMFGKHMLDAAFGQFRTLVRYVCWKRGKFFGEVAASGTSQECPECGGEVKKDLSMRVHECKACGYTTDRDVAAARNIRNRGIASISTAGLAGKETACADGLPGTDESLSRQVSQPRKRKTRKSKK